MSSKPGSSSTNRFAALAPPSSSSASKRRRGKSPADDAGLSADPTPTPGGSETVAAAGGAETRRVNGSAMMHRAARGARGEKGGVGMYVGDEEVLEMGGEESARRAKQQEAGESHLGGKEAPTAEDDDKTRMPGLSLEDRKAMVLLVVLYLLQGIPVGLAFGSIPFLLRASLSYSQIGIFSLASFPYSLKLLWSPIVDACYFSSIGRRKSWIIPVQGVVGLMLWWLSGNVELLMGGTEVDGETSVPDVNKLTVLFFTLVLFAATQDIAVDGWALELLSRDNLSYASTAQTVGLNIGYFLSFTVFLAFNSLEFSNNRFRTLFGLALAEEPLLTLPSYLRFSGICFIVVTLYLLLLHPETPSTASSSSTTSPDDADMGIKKVYAIMWQIIKLPHVQTFVLLHLVVKLGTATNDAVTSLKLLERGLSKEDLALAVLVDFPFQIFFGYLAARWSSGGQPLRPWIAAMWCRLAFAAWGMALVHYFPQTTPLPNYYFLLVIASTVLSSFAQTIQFVGISAFHTQIADPLIGGTYMTLLNTVSNLGGTWPKYFVFKGVDYFTIATCRVKEDNAELVMSTAECVSDHGKAACADLGGVCNTERDGYYIMQALCLSLGVVLLMGLVAPQAKRLQALPASAWQVKKSKTSLS